QPPAEKAQQFQLTINTLGRLTSPGQFADIIVKTGTGNPMVQGAGAGGTGASSSAAGQTTSASQGGTAGTSSPVNLTGPTPTATGVARLRHVVTVDPKTRRPRVELGSQQYSQSCTLDGQQSVALSIFTLPGSNALSTAEGVYAKMRELQTRFPEGV